MNPKELRKRNWRLRLNREKVKVACPNEADLIAAFVREKGVEKCPPAHADHALKWAPVEKIT